MEGWMTLVIEAAVGLVIWLAGVIFGLWWAADVLREERAAQVKRRLLQAQREVAAGARVIQRPDTLLDELLRESDCGNYHPDRNG